MIIGVWSSDQPIPKPYWADGYRQLTIDELAILKSVVAEAPAQEANDGSWPASEY